MRLLAVISAACLLCVGESQSRDTLFVSSATSTPGDGRTWERALVNLQDAIRNAQRGDQIWVASGTYVVGAEGMNISKDVQLYGGFVGTEQFREARDWRRNRTVIQAKSNAAPILTITSVSDATIIDGLVVQGAPFRAVIIDDSDCQISNTTFQGNTSRTGGALYITRNSNPTIRFCVFKDNTVRFDGGAIAIVGDELSRSTSVTIENCFFEKNRAVEGGGAIVIQNTEATSVISSSVFIDGSAENAGAILVNGANVDVSHCTFMNNASNNFPTNARSLFAQGECVVDLRNSIVWDNFPTVRSHVLTRKEVGVTTEIASTANAIKADFLYGTWQQHPTFTDESRPWGVDGEWGTADDGLQLVRESYLVDQAVFHSNDLTVKSDITARPRASGSASDIGAYEVQREGYIPLDQLRSLLGSSSLVYVFRNADVELRRPDSEDPCREPLILSSNGRRDLERVKNVMSVVTTQPSEALSGRTCITRNSAEILAGFADATDRWEPGVEGGQSQRLDDLLRPLSAGPRIIVAEESVIQQTLGFNSNEVRTGDALVVDNRTGEVEIKAHITVDGWSRLGLADIPASVSLYKKPSQARVIYRGEDVPLPSCHPCDVTVVDVNGRIVVARSLNRNPVISTGDWSPGLYVIWTGTRTAPLIVLP